MKACTYDPYITLAAAAAGACINGTPSERKNDKLLISAKRHNSFVSFLFRSCWTLTERRAIFIETQQRDFLRHHKYIAVLLPSPPPPLNLRVRIGKRVYAFFLLRFFRQMYK